MITTGSNEENNCQLLTINLSSSDAEFSSLVGWIHSEPKCHRYYESFEKFKGKRFSESMAIFSRKDKPFTSSTLFLDSR